MTVTVSPVAELGVPNKPMVPTGPVTPAVSPLHPLRRHIGQPLGSFGRRREVSRVGQGPGLDPSGN